ncbi:hypothetical protein Bca4012_101270 [Brassica carinata]|uniref:Uncharacterized protein n=1 Tax=Brassica carinata TaxID=52824 RepID=A0A8X7PMV3_BRACI|nr:hypothetical protein Bca52824_083699 [Brassica carinata]
MPIDLQRRCFALISKNKSKDAKIYDNKRRDTIIPPLSIFIHRPRRGPSIGRRRTQPKERNRAAVKHQRRCYAESEADCSPSIETGATSESTTDQPPSIGASPEYVVSPRDPG